MKHTFRLLCVLLLAAPLPVLALGLGDIRLSSALNQPLTATIELVGATPEELPQLRASLAPREAFTRAGLERPGFLSGLRFKVAKDAGGRDVLEVRSAEAIAEPFITMLVAVDWPRGRLIREYTVLLDPPVFETQPSAAAPQVAARTGTTAAAAAGAITRTPTAPPPREPAAGAGGGEYRVVARDTLSSIVARSAGGGGAVGRGDVNRLMVATYRSNSAAFDGNINRLHKGALLRVPALADLGALSATEANREVAHQMSEWRSARPAGSAGEGARLRLVTPAASGPGAGASAPPAAPGAGDQQVAQLQRELAETKRLLELRSAELARLQGKPVAAPPAPAATPPAPVATQPAPAATPPAAAAKPVPAPETPAAQPTPAVEPPATAPKPAAKPAAPAAAAPEHGFLATLGDNLFGVILGGVALLAAALFAFNFVRRRREQSELDEVLSPGGGDSGRFRAQPGAASPAREEARRPSNIVVEESDDDSGEFVAPPISRPAPKPAPAPVAAGKSLEDTMSSETAINLEQADPLAEADFHMAYGLYDQAADIVKLAIDRDPERRDLRLKLLEVYFVWGNKDAFLEVARDLGRGRDKAPVGEWDKVAIMGRQIATDDPLFAGAARSHSAGVDLDLEAAGGSGMDLELLGEGPGVATTTMSSVDLDLGQALAVDSAADTGESRALGSSHLDFTLDGTPAANTSGATTREMRPRVETPTVEQPALRGGFDLDAGGEPTVETPTLSGTAGNTIRDKLGSALFKRNTATDATAELSLDDLGFEIDKSGSTSTSLEALSITDHAEETHVASPADAPTMVAGLDERTRAELEAAGRRAADTQRAAARGPDLDRTQETPQTADLERTHETPRGKAPGVDYTGTLRMTESEISGSTGTAQVLGTGPLDMDLGEFEKSVAADTVEQPRRDEARFATDIFAETGTHHAANGLDLDVGAAPASSQHESTVTERVGVNDLAMSELEPVTLSEVGTKLDLARAYMDMGDPDGARSILQEVLAEGSASQKQEAQRLIQTLPG